MHLSLASVLKSVSLGVYWLLRLCFINQPVPLTDVFWILLAADIKDLVVLSWGPLLPRISLDPLPSDINDTKFILSQLQHQTFPSPSFINFLSNIVNSFSFKKNKTSSNQSYPIGFSIIMKMFHICTVQYGKFQSHVKDVLRIFNGNIDVFIVLEGHQLKAWRYLSGSTVQSLHN